MKFAYIKIVGNTNNWIYHPFEIGKCFAATVEKDGKVVALDDSQSYPVSVTISYKQDYEIVREWDPAEEPKQTTLVGSVADLLGQPVSKLTVEFK